MKNGKPKYKVTWGEGQAQGNLSKTEAMRISFDLLKTYSNILISIDK